MRAKNVAMIAVPLFLMGTVVLHSAQAGCERKCKEVTTYCASGQGSTGCIQYLYPRCAICQAYPICRDGPGGVCDEDPTLINQFKTGICTAMVCKPDPGNFFVEGFCATEGEWNLSAYFGARCEPIITT